MNVPIRLVVDKDVTGFLEHAGGLLHRREAEYGLMLGLAEGMKGASPSTSSVFPVCLRSEDQYGITRAAYFQTRPENGIVTHLERCDAEIFVQHLVGARIEVGGVVGPTASAEIFSEEYTFAAHRSMNVGMAQKILKLESVIMPRLCAGRYRLAGMGDSDLVARWYRAFAEEAMPWEKPKDVEFYRDVIEARIHQGIVHLWDVGGKVVAITHTPRPTRTGITIGMVYTPKEERGHGYASNLVAVISQKMLDSGKKFCVLYTDAANPTSNKIYQSIGYKIVSDSTHFMFGEGV